MTMKKKLLFVLLNAPLAVAAQDSGAYHISGRLTHIQASRVYLIYTRGGHRVMDSAQVTNGAYTFTGTVDESQPAGLLDQRPTFGLPPAREMAQIYLTPESFSVAHVDSFSHAVITGSVANTDFSRLQGQLKTDQDKENALLPDYRAAQQNSDVDAVKAIQTQAHGIEADMKKIYGQYAVANPHSPVALYALEMSVSGEADPSRAQSSFDHLDAAIRTSVEGKAFGERLAVSAKTAVGKDAMDFTENDAQGNPVKLSSFRGKYVLLDFWASWCMPCRAENPRVVEAYQKYHPKGFEILGVSLDRPGDKDKWLKAIQDDQLTWTNVSDLQFWNNAAVLQYGIHSIPQNFLIDPQGKIIARGLRGEDLEKKLGEIFKN